MTKLTIRKQLFLFIALLLLSCVLVIFLPSHSPDKVIKAPLIIVLLLELIISVAVAFLCFRNTQIVQVVQVASSFLAVAYSIGIVGNLTSQVNQSLGGIEIIVSWIQLVIMNIGGFIGTVSLYAPPEQEKPIVSNVVRTIKPRESKAAANVEIAPAAAITQSEVKFQTSEVTPLEASTVEATATPKVEVAPSVIPESQIETAKQQQITQQKKATVITDPRIQIQSKRTVGTFTKLQALSEIKGQMAAKPAESSKSILEELEEHIEGASASAVPKVEETTVVNPQEGFGRLSTNKPSIPSAIQTSGSLPAVDKLFIDPQAIENIAKNEGGTPNVRLSNARIISAAKAQGISAVLKKINTYPGVNGCLIVGHDGLVILSTVIDADKDALGALSAALLNTSNLTTLKIEMGELKQIVLLTESGSGPTTTILTDMQVGVLVVFFATQELDQVDSLLEIIQATVYG